MSQIEDIAVGFASKLAVIALPLSLLEVGSGRFVERFETVALRDGILCGGPWRFDNAIVVVAWRNAGI